MSFLRPQQHVGQAERRPLLSARRRHAGRRTEQSDDDDDDDDSNMDDEDELPVMTRHMDPESQNQLPIFSSARLDRIPTYHLQHSIRMLVVRKVDTTLSWDQLRTPQISQFLVKPIQQEIRSKHLSSATLYALLANALQFQKDGQVDPGTIGLSTTRGFICELLAMRLLKDYSTRESIDALFYDFDPLQGLSARPGFAPSQVRSKALARLSTVEIAIRAHAKRFLAHPLVVQQLQAVWAGSIVFHSVADTLHRSQPGFLHVDDRHVQGPSYGAWNEYRIDANPAHGKGGKGKANANLPEPSMRRTVTIYDPADASIFKLSRLRVPRYRQLFSTLSFAAMLSLFLAVLIERSTEITALELLFWFWGAGYMLDELVGFSEQGFELYIISVWNAFDIGILLLFFGYYVLRLYGLLIPYDGRSKRHVANMAYDVLGTTSVLLFPRLFSVLDHYRYFSQLLIAFRMMAVDLAAILILIVISCSGFFIAFTFSFADTSNDTRETAYTIFKIVMGFTPAAWDIWDNYNFLGKAILSVFLVICHFLIVTILITVLTNSFMAVVQNSNAEHQFLFAVNTISMVKSDALFSYVAPTNIFGWILSPIRFVIPFRQFVRLNRTVIKITHLPMLLVIFLYERLVLARRDFKSNDLIDARGPDKGTVPAFSIRGPEDVFSPGPRLREASMATYRKDQALEEVFKQPTPYMHDTREGGARQTSLMRNKSSNMVHNWMHGVGREGGAATPVEQSMSIVNRLETRKPLLQRHKTAPTTHYFEGARSAVSDPEDIHQPFENFGYMREDAEDLDMSMEDIPQQTDADGDDEMATVDEDDYDAETHEESAGNQKRGPTSDKENSASSQRPSGSQRSNRRPLQEARNSAVHSELSSNSPKTPAPRRKVHTAWSENGVYGPLAASTPDEPTTQQRIASKGDRTQHVRTTSSATILFAPLDSKAGNAVKRKSSVAASPINIHGSQASSQGFLGEHNASARALSVLSKQVAAIAAPGTSSPRRKQSKEEAQDAFGPLLSRKALQQKHSQNSSPNMASLLKLDRNRRPSYNARALDLASDIGDNRAVPQTGEFLSASFGTQLEMAAYRRQWGRGNNRRSQDRAFGRLPTNRSHRLVSGLSDDINEDDDEDEHDEVQDGDDDEHGQPQLRGNGSDTRRLNRLMLARMSSLEEGFRDILREVRGLSAAQSQVHSRGSRSIVDGVGSEFAATTTNAGDASATDKKAATSGRASD